MEKRVKQHHDLANMNDREMIDAFQWFIEQSTGKYVNECEITYGEEM